MKTILCPTDFSESSENTLKYAAELAKSFNSKIILLHTYEAPVIYTDVTVSAVPIDNDDWKFIAEEKLNRFYSSMRSVLHTIECELCLQLGLPSSRIVEVATQKNVDLIIMATSQSSQIERFLVGSNATRVIKDSQCMLLLVPPEARFTGLKKIIFTTDLSSENLTASHSIMELASKYQSELIFLNIDNQTLIKEKQDADEINKQIEKYVTYPKMKGYVCTDLNVIDGISSFLMDHDADCLAMVTHHRKFMDALMHQGFTKKVAVQTHIPLLVIHIKN